MIPKNGDKWWALLIMLVCIFFSANLYNDISQRKQSAAQRLEIVANQRVIMTNQTIIINDQVRILESQAQYTKFVQLLHPSLTHTDGWNAVK